MEVDTRLQEMEEEIKVLKAEIRNVLLDIREVILERTNPLGDVPETATIRMDLHTTASAMAAEAASHEARAAMNAAEQQHVAAEPEDEPEIAPLPRFETEPVGLTPLPEDEDAEPEEPEEAPPPKVIRRDPRELKMLAEEKDKQQTYERATERVEIPPAYRVEFAPLSGNGSISDWLTEALEVVGPQGLSRIIAVHRSWGHLPPNLSRALAYIQEMLDETEDSNPAWLRVMRRLDELASL